MKKRKFRLFDAILAMTCIIMGTESCPSASAIGNSQYFWWIFLLIFFFLPYGLVSSELGTTYWEESGIYYWVKRAFGPKWASRTAYYCWINFPIWIASCAVAASGALQLILGTTFTVPIKILIEIDFSVLVCVLGVFEISKHKVIINIGTIFKMMLLIGLGALGIYTAITKGSATQFTLESFAPTLSLKSLNYVSVILFCFIGFEIVATFRKQVTNPRQQFPIIVVVSGVLIALSYLLCSFGINVAIPVEQLSLDTGVIDAFSILLNGNQFIIKIIAILFIITVFVSVLSWAEGTYLQCIEASKDHGMPKIFKYEKKGLNIGSSAATLLVAVVIILCEPFFSGDVFWKFFALNIVTLLLTYLPMFLAFKKLRRKDRLAIRPYKVPGNNLFINLITYIPTIIMIIAIILTLLPQKLVKLEFIANIPLYIGTIISIVIGELFVKNTEK